VVLPGVRTFIPVIGLIPEVPGENALVVGKGSDDSFDVILKARSLGRIGEDLGSRRLHPAGVVHTRDGRMLRTELWERLPAGIEEHEDGPDVVAVGDDQELVDALRGSFGILLPEQV